LFLNFVDYEQAFDSVNRRAFEKILSLYGKQDKYSKLLSGRYENNTAAVKVENEFSSWFRIKSGVIPLFMDHFDGFSVMEHKKGNGKPRNQIERKHSPGLGLR